jgi:hypothetical protein
VHARGKAPSARANAGQNGSAGAAETQSGEAREGAEAPPRLAAPHRSPPAAATTTDAPPARTVQPAASIDVESDTSGQRLSVWKAAGSHRRSPRPSAPCTPRGELAELRCARGDRLTVSSASPALTLSQ